MGDLPSKVLVVDNDESVVNTIENMLKNQQVTVLKALNWEAALYQFNNTKLDAVVLALELTDMPATVLIQKWRKHDVLSKRDTSFIIMSGAQRSMGDDGLIKELEDVLVMPKPIVQQRLVTILVQAMNLAKQREKFQEIDTSLEPLIKQENWAQVTKVAKEKLEPIGPKGMFKSAELHDQANEKVYALEVYNKLLKEDDKNIKVLNEIGKLNLEMGHLDAAKEAYIKADHAAPMHLDRLNNMAKMYIERQEPSEAIEKFKQIIAVTPDEPDAKYKMYEDLMVAGFDKYAQDFCKESSTPKEVIRYYNNRGVIHSKEAKYQDAIKEYDRALKIIPDAKELYRILFNKAIATINTKDKALYQEANKMLLKVLELNPQFTKAQEKIELLKKFLTAPGSAGPSTPPVPPAK